ncbi:MAG: uncharacterized protein KVP18_002062 [Porospora cf. gigantea A]|uniref:uncharacterized protein n=1 Tax=Porospora cf. gigantea A TaxID=2853593 RepID=UPI00355988B9|nr:MAG: hypothetical protein KVP18_002062 [Porospora cf. gigantea A]
MGCITSVHEDSRALVERFGRFTRQLQPGLRCVGIPCVHRVRVRVSTRQLLLKVLTETKCKDNVFLVIETSVQYQVVDDRIPEAFYKVQDVKQLIERYTNDTIRSIVPALSLERIFVEQDALERAVFDSLSELKAYGWNINNSLVTDIKVNTTVAAAMNNVEATRRRRVAAKEVAGMNKFTTVKEAEGESESLYLSGVGTAMQRKAIVNGLISSMQQLIEGTACNKDSAKELVLLTQYIDLLKTLASEKHAGAVFTDDSAISNDQRDNVLQALVA